MAVDKRQSPYVLVLDCGATNVRTGAVAADGTVLHVAYRPNGPVRQRSDKDWLIWDIEKIWSDLLACASESVSAMGSKSCAAVVVTAYSDDGAPVDQEGRLLYPVISWHCPRTVEIARQVAETDAGNVLHRITGEQLLPQHTLFRLLWLRKNEPGVLEKAHSYLMFPHIINHRLTGEFANDPTTADSMLLLDIFRRDYSEEILRDFAIPESLLPPILEPGAIIGRLLPDVARITGLDTGTPVIVGGHDTQFAILGSGGTPGDIVLSSGTWEILFTRTLTYTPTDESRVLGLKYECDVEQGLFNLGTQWLGSGALEWLGNLLYPDVPERFQRYTVAQSEAMSSPPGANGIRILPDLVTGTVRTRGFGADEVESPAQSTSHSVGGGGIPSGPVDARGGRISGCQITTVRGDLYRAMIESLAVKLRKGVSQIERKSQQPAERIIVVGGGSQNTLWNQIRADVLGRPLFFKNQPENTLIGAAMVGFVGAGVHHNLDEAREAADFSGVLINPGPQSSTYADLFQFE